MPIAAAVIPAVIGAGTAVYGASQSKKAAKKANAAQQQVAQQQLAAQQAALDRVQSLNQPFIDGGQGAYAKLLAQYGIGSPTPPASAPRPTQAPATNVSEAQSGPRPSIIPGQEKRAAAALNKTPGGPAGTYPAEAGGQPDYQAYWDANPDLAANNASTPTVDLTGDGQINDADRGAKHWQEFGQGEGRALPQTAAPAQVQVDPNGPPDLMNAERPSAAPRESIAMGDYGAAPDQASFFSNFEAEPGYQFRLTEGLNGVNAASAVRGKLRSGDAAKALERYGSGLASQEYNNWFARQNTMFQNAQNQFQGNRSFAGNLWNQQQGRADSNYAQDQGRRDTNFNTDRQYQTGRQDTATGNLFDLARIGVGAAGAVGGAANNFANNASSIYGSQANAASDAAYARANANAGLVGSLGGTATNLFTNWPGGGGGGANLGQVNYGQPVSPFGSYGKVGVF